MFLAHRPSSKEIERFLGKSAGLPLSYPSIGIAQGSPPGYSVDEASIVLGRGEAAFARAAGALRAWRHFALGWVEVFPAFAPLEPGTVVAVLVRHLGFWSLNGCRVVYLVDRDASASEAGFAYGTLSNHAEMGEEIFCVSLRPDSGEVRYSVRAVSRPRALAARLGYPITRALQARFRRDSLAAMQRAVAEA
jgi:uncharacterized protein (UPF0548 family)